MEVFLTKSQDDGTIKSISQRLPTAVIYRRFQFSRDKGGDPMSKPGLSHFLKPGCMQVLSPPAPDKSERTE